MISEKVREYIEKNDICSEHLFRDWNGFLELLYAEGGRISGILWWDYCQIAEQHESVGMGGYYDPDDRAYMYAETQEYRDCLELLSLDEIKGYIAEVQRKGICYRNGYHSFCLVPSFDLLEE